MQRDIIRAEYISCWKNNGAYFAGCINAIRKSDPNEHVYQTAYRNFADVAIKLTDILYPVIEEVAK